MSELNYNKIKENLDKNIIENLYFLEGDSDLVNEIETQILDKILTKKYTDFDFNIFNSDNLSCESLYNSIQTPPITAEYKCVLIRDISWENIFNEDLEELLKIISDVPEFCVLIITQISQVIGLKNSNKLKKIRDYVKKNIEYIYLNVSKKDILIEKELINWAKNDYQKELSLELSKKISILCQEYTIRQIKNELKKICELEQKNYITEDTINKICETSTKINIFELPKCLFSGNIKKCFDILNILLEQNEDIFSIISILNNEYADINRVKILLNLGVNTNELTKIFDYSRKEFRVKIALDRAKKISDINLKNSLKYLIEADLKLKSSTIDTKTVICELLLLLYKNMN